MSRRHVKACPKEFREQVVKLALSCGRRSVRSPRSSRSRWTPCGAGTSWQSPTSVHDNAGTSLECSRHSSRSIASSTDPLSRSLGPLMLLATLEILRQFRTPPRVCGASDLRGSKCVRVPTPARCRACWRFTGPPGDMLAGNGRVMNFQEPWELENWGNFAKNSKQELFDRAELRKMRH